VGLESVGEMMLMPMKDKMYVRTHVHTHTHNCVHVVQWALKSVNEIMLMLTKDGDYDDAEIRLKGYATNKRSWPVTGIMSYTVRYEHTRL
jgi:hypothetical protein